MADSKQAQKYWWIKGKGIGIGWLDRDTNQNYALSAVTEAETVTVHYKSKLTKISAIDTTLTNALPPQFHDALVTRAIERGYEINSNPEIMQLALYWGKKFGDMLKRIQEFTNTERTKTPKMIKSIYPYAIK